MKGRLTIFTFALLLLPLAGLYLSGAEWSNLMATFPAEDQSAGATLRTSIMLLIYVLIINHTVKRLTKNDPLDTQRRFFIELSIASALTGWLLSYLNIFAASWTAPQDHPWLVQVLLYTPLFALLAPAVLVTSALFGAFPGRIKPFDCRPPLPATASTIMARILLPLALLGLMSGAAWPAQLFWLLWISPLLLLTSLQLLSHERAILAQPGDRGRVICAALSGIAVGNLAVISYQSNASLDINLPNMLIAQSGLALFGLLCLQLGDVLDQPDKSLIQDKP
ncbi:MAG: hypothetical protein WC216_01685 [Gallionella sp.]|jgi:hypothetical protein